MSILLVIFVLCILSLLTFCVCVEHIKWTPKNKILTEGQEEEVKEEKQEKVRIGPSLDNIVGHDSFRTYVKDLIDKYKRTGESIPHMLFYGTSGTGKTALASAIADELGVGCYFITGTQLSTKPEILKMLDSIRDGDIVVIDELHRLREMHATIFYSVMQDSNYAIEGRLVEVPKVTFVGVTTHEGLLPSALRNRFVLKIQFRPYSDQEIKKIVNIVYKFSQNIVDEITRISFGIARDALTLGRAISASCDKDSDATMKTFMKVRDLLGYDQNGLTYAERDAIEYLKVNNNTPVGIATLANAINVERVTVEERVKPRLLQLGLAKTNGTRGLNLTQKGLGKVN